MPTSANNSLSEDTLRLKALIEMASDGIITIDRKGVIESVNRAACSLFGYEAAEMVGNKVNMLMTDYDRQHHDEYMDRYHQTNSPRIIGIGREVTGKRKDGKTFPLRLAVSEVTLGEKTIYTGILHDISEIKAASEKIMGLNSELEQKVLARTEELGATLERMLQVNENLEKEMEQRRKAEATLRQREKELEKSLATERELNELKSRFVSMASHEFKTPLSTVLSSVELIEMYQAADQQPKRERHITKIKGAIRQLTDVLNDFLSLSKLEQGRIETNPQWIDLAAVLSTAIENSEGQFKAGQEVVLELGDQPTRLFSDPKVLLHILMNLISNAAKYSEEGQSIWIRSSTSGEGCQIEIEDQGIGIPEEAQVHLFTRFFRARNAENIKGTGLGLNIVKQYLDLLGGSVSFRSELGKGTTFTILLPHQKNA